MVLPVLKTSEVRSDTNLRFYKDDGKEYISAEAPKEVTLEIALTEIDKLSTIEGNFIGFTGEKEETIQFVRFEENAWLIDVPINEKGTYSYSLQDDDLTTERVKDVVRRFFVNENWKSSLNLRKVEQEDPKGLIEYADPDLCGLGSTLWLRVYGLALNSHSLDRARFFHQGYVPIESVKTRLKTFGNPA